MTSTSPSSPSLIVAQSEDDTFSEEGENKHSLPGLVEILADRALPVAPSDSHWDYIIKIGRCNPEIYEYIVGWHKRILKAAGLNSYAEMIDRSGDIELIERTRRHILNQINLMHRFGDSCENKEWAMDRYGDKINNLLARLIEDFLPAHNQSLGQYNPIYACNDLGELILRTVDSNFITAGGISVERDHRERYEAKRKLALMIHAMNVDHEMDKKRNYTKIMSDVFERYIYNYRHREAVGGTRTRWMISEHDGENDNKCMNCRFVDEPPDSLQDNEFIEQIDFRMIRCVDDEGVSHEVEFGVQMSKKSQEATYLKLLRDPSRPISDIRDLARCRLLFKDEFERELAIKTIKARLDNSDKNISITDIYEKKMGKSTKREVPIDCKKLNLSVKNKSEQVDFELQAFTPKDYVNYFCWKPHAWQTYAVNRFFRGLFRTLWPKHHYLNLNIDSLIKSGVERMYLKEIEARRILPSIINS